MLLVRSLLQFFKQNLHEFVRAGNHKSESTAVDDLIEATLWNRNVALDTTKEDLTIAILSLMNANSMQKNRFQPHGLLPKSNRNRELYNVL